MNVVYTLSFVIGFVLVAATFVTGIGKFHIHIGHHDFFGHFGHVNGHHAHAPHADHSSHVPAFSIAALMTFLTWFGGAGLVLQRITSWPVLAIGGVAAVIGVAGGVAVNAVLGVLQRNEKVLEETPMVGVVGRITIPIREGGTGEIVYTQNGTRHVSGARSEDGVPIPKGIDVVVTSYDKGIAYVTAVSELAAISPRS
jgi:hypothetical protein